MLAQLKAPLHLLTPLHHDVGTGNDLVRSLRLKKTEYDYIHVFTLCFETKLETNLVGIFLNTLQHLNAAKSWHFPTFRSAGQITK